jgi:AraC family transcriptional regulator
MRIRFYFPLSNKGKDRMLVVDLDRAARSLAEGSRSFAHGLSSFARMGTGEGGFAFGALTLGVVLCDLPTHATSHGSEKRRRIPLKAGQGWVFPSGIEGWCAWQGDTAFLNVEIGAEVLGEAGLADPASIRPLVGEIDPLAVQMGLALHAAGEGGPALYRDSLGTALAAHLAGTLAKREADASEVSAAQRVDPRIARVLDAIENRLAEDLSLEALAAIAAMSPFHFTRRFREVTGRAPYRYLVERRIEQAKILLKSGSAPIADIAFQVGWENPSHFAAAFKSHVGVTAGAWRTG